MTDQPLWTPAHPETTQLAAFMVQQGFAMETDYQTFWQWSIDNPEKFWNAVWDFCDVIGDKGHVVLENGNKMPGAIFFPKGV